ncbi:MAG: hypothetical protein V4567_05365 [Pseudomonadota bacterium]
MSTPFKGTYYVDPSFSGTPDGSESNPFPTIAAAFAAMIALGLVAGIVRIPPGVTVVENVVFPNTGGNWEIACDENFVTSSVGPRITGTITVDAAATTVSAFRLTGIIVNGNISGVCGGTGGAELVLTSVRHIGTLTTSKTAGFFIVAFKGRGSPSANKTGGSSSAAVSSENSILADGWVFEGPVTEGTGNGPFNPSPGSQWHDCQFGSLNGVPVAINLNALAANAAFYDCYFVGPVTFTTGVPNYTIKVDGATMASLEAQGCTLSGTNIKLKTLNSNASFSSVDTDNRSPTAFALREPEGLYVCSFDATLLSPGTSGDWQFAVNYTDITGTAVTANIGASLNISGAAGSKTEGSLRFHHDGSSSISFSSNGVTVPGGLQLGLICAVARVN